MSFPSLATNDFLTGRKAARTGSEVDLISERYSLTLGTADLALNVIGAIGILPAGHVPVAVMFDSDDLDSGATPLIAWSIGIGNLALRNAAGAASADAADTLISTTAADGGGAWGTGITTSQTGGQSQVLSKALSRVQSVQYDRDIVLQATAAAATAVSGIVGVTILYRPA